MRSFIWLALAALLVLAWIGSFVVFHVAGFLIHLLLIFAVISLVIHFSEEDAPPEAACCPVAFKSRTANHK
jgi:hypothetical protein